MWVAPHRTRSGKFWFTKGEYSSGVFFAVSGPIWRISASIAAPCPVEIRSTVNTRMEWAMAGKTRPMAARAAKPTLSSGAFPFIVATLSLLNSLA